MLNYMLQYCASVTKHREKYVEYDGVNLPGRVVEFMQDVTLGQDLPLN